MRRTAERAGHACDPDMALSNFVDIVNAMQSSQRDLEHVIPDSDALSVWSRCSASPTRWARFMRFKPQLVEAAAVDSCSSHLFNHAQRRARLLKAVSADRTNQPCPSPQGSGQKRPTALRSSYRNQLAAIIARMPWRTTRPPSNRPSAANCPTSRTRRSKARWPSPATKPRAASTCASPSSAWANSAHRN